MIEVTRIDHQEDDSVEWRIRVWPVVVRGLLPAWRAVKVALAAVELYGSQQAAIARVSQAPAAQDAHAQETRRMYRGDPSQALRGPENRSL